MNEILILYSSSDGHTQKICNKLAIDIEDKVAKASAFKITEAPELDKYDKIIIGASVRYGYHSKDVLNFINSNLQILEEKKSAFFSVNLTARKPNKNTPQTNPYVRTFLSKIKWNPDLVSVFAGKVNYPAYKFTDKMIIKFIMILTKGPTDTTQVIEYTDWEKVREFAREIIEL